MLFASGASVTDGRDSYAPLAPVYDEWHEALGLEWVTRVETLLERFGLARDGLSFLDLGCGTGTLLIALRTKHPSWQLAGLDISAAMLAEARQKPRAETITWLEGPFEEARLHRNVDVVGCFFDAFNHLTDDGAFEAAIRAAAAALVPGGLLVFDLNNRRGCAERSLTGARIDRRTWAVSMDSRFDESSSIETTRVIVRGAVGPPVETVILRRCFSSDEVSRALGAAGLVSELEETWSLAYGAIAGKTWYVARKT